MRRAGVVIVYRDALFAQGLASLLRTKGAVEVLGTIATRDAASGRIRTLRPAVVLLEGDASEGERRALLARLLRAAPWVVEVGLHRETVAVHRRAGSRESRRFLDLVAHLAGEPMARATEGSATAPAG